MNVYKNDLVVFWATHHWNVEASVVFFWTFYNATGTVVVVLKVHECCWFGVDEWHGRPYCWEAQSSPRHTRRRKRGVGRTANFPFLSRPCWTQHSGIQTHARTCTNPPSHAPRCLALPTGTDSSPWFCSS